MISAVLITTAPNCAAACITAKPTHAVIVHIHFTLQPSLKSAPRCSTKVELPIDTLISAHRVRAAVHGDHPAESRNGRLLWNGNALLHEPPDVPMSPCNCPDSDSHRGGITTRAHAREPCGTGNRHQL
jgi:hypothetical protein